MSDLIPILSPRAAQDLQDIWEWIAVENPDAALRTLIDLRAATLLLAANPELGRRRNDLLPGLRCHPKGRHLIFYRVHESCLEVVRVLHGSRDVQSIF